MEPPRVVESTTSVAADVVVPALTTVIVSSRLAGAPK